MEGVWRVPLLLSAILFDARVRSSGSFASYTLASGLIGGFSPAIDTGLYAWSNGTWPISLTFVVIGLISLVCVSLGRRPDDAADKSRFTGPHGH